MEDSQHPFGAEKQWYEDLLGRGAGDPDQKGYPGAPRLKATQDGLETIRDGWYTIHITGEINGITNEEVKLGNLE